jgi:hypothetical protein
MRVSLNGPHVVLWGRVIGLWIGYVGFCVLLGWSLHPRVDEIVFAVFLPAIVVLPYIAFCFAVAMLGAWIKGRHHRSMPFGASSVVTYPGPGQRTVAAQKGITNGLGGVRPYGR